MGKIIVPGPVFSLSRDLCCSATQVSQALLVSQEL